MAEVGGAVYSRLAMGVDCKVGRVKRPKFQDMMWLMKDANLLDLWGIYMHISG